jgi:hypothetical protein
MLHRRSPPQAFPKLRKRRTVYLLQRRRSVGAAEHADLPEARDEAAAEVEAHEPVEPAHGRAADEERRHGGGGGGRRRGLLGRLLQLDDGGVRAHGGQQAPHHVAHAAPGPREDHHGALPDQPPDALRGGLRVAVVHRQAQPPPVHGRGLAGHHAAHPQRRVPAVWCG